MTLSSEHEDIVDDFRFAAADFFIQKKYEIGSYAIAVEHIMAAFLCPGLRHLGLHADCYLFPPDGHCVIPVEIGKMKDGKWDRIIDATDGAKVRILRIDFQKNIHWIHPRDTEFEKKFMAYLRANGFDA